MNVDFASSGIVTNSINCEHKNNTILEFVEVKPEDSPNKEPVYSIEKCNDCDILYKRWYDNLHGMSNLIYLGESMKRGFKTMGFTKKEAERAKSMGESLLASITATVYKHN